MAFSSILKPSCLCKIKPLDLSSDSKGSRNSRSLADRSGNDMSFGLDHFKFEYFHFISLVILKKLPIFCSLVSLVPRFVGSIIPVSVSILWLESL